MASRRSVEALPRLARHLDGVREPERQLAAALVVEQVDLVQGQQARRVARADLVEHVVDGGHHLVHLLLGHRGVHDVHDQVGAERLLERRREGLHQLVRQLADEADGVGEQVLAARDLERARGRVERVEEALRARPPPSRSSRSAAWTCRRSCSRPARPWAGRRARARARIVARVAFVSRRRRRERARCGCAPAGGRSRSGTRPGPWCRCRRPCGRRRGARGASTARACARGCTRAGPARPGACPRPSARGRRRCRG